MVKKQIYHIGRGTKVAQIGGRLLTGSRNNPVSPEAAMVAVATVAKYLHWIKKDDVRLPAIHWEKNTMYINGRKVVHLCEDGRADYICFTHNQIQGLATYAAIGDEKSAWPLLKSWYELSKHLDIRRTVEYELEEGEIEAAMQKLDSFLRSNLDGTANCFLPFKSIGEAVGHASCGEQAWSLYVGEDPWLFPYEFGLYEGRLGTSYAGTKGVYMELVDE